MEVERRDLRDPETLVAEMRATMDESVASLPPEYSEPASEADYLPSAQEMLEAAKRQAWKLLTGDQKTPPHVMAKTVDLAVRLAAAEVEHPDELVETGSIFEMVDSLPLARGIELLERKEQTILAELEAVRTQRSKLLIQQDRDASQVA